MHVPFVVGVLAAAVAARWLKTSPDEDREQLHVALPKNLIRPLPYRIAKASDSGETCSSLPVHAGAKWSRLWWRRK
jgi:hypothetical protein